MTSMQPSHSSGPGCAQASTAGPAAASCCKAARRRLQDACIIIAQCSRPHKWAAVAVKAQRYPTVSRTKRCKHTCRSAQPPSPSCPLAAAAGSRQRRRSASDVHTSSAVAYPCPLSECSHSINAICNQEHGPTVYLDRTQHWVAVSVAAYVLQHCQPVCKELSGHHRHLQRQAVI